MNFAVFISTKAAVTAFAYEMWLLNVTRADPIGYLFLSVSIPEINKELECDQEHAKNDQTDTYQRKELLRINHP